jgi:hypothetical protein
MAKQFRIISVYDIGKQRKKTSIGRNPGTSTMNKSKKRSFKKYRGQGK